MGLLNNLFGKKAPTLWSLKLEDLTRERITLHQELHKLDLEMSRLHNDEIQLKSEYAEAQILTQKRSVARKIQNTRLRTQAVDAKSSHCNKLMQTVNNFITIKENMDFFNRMGVATVLTQMDMGEIEEYINEATVEGALQQELLARVLQQVGDGAKRVMENTVDLNLDELMVELDGEKNNNLKDADAALDAAIAKGEQAARQARSPIVKEPPNHQTAKVKSYDN